MADTNKPAIPQVPAGIDPSIRNFLVAVKQILDTQYNTQPNSKLVDKVVTFGDFVDAGLASLGTVYGGLSPSQVIYTDFGPGIDVTVPPAITGFAAAGALSNILISWDSPTYGNYAYTEIWRAGIDDIGQSVLIGTSFAAVYADVVGAAGTFYYWARTVTTSDIAGPFNGTAGTLGKTGYDPAYIMDIMTSQRWEAVTDYFLFETTAPAVEIVKSNIHLIFQVTTAGTSGGSEPNWSGVSGLGGAVADGTVIWTAVEAGNVPFVIGTVDGREVVVMNVAFIGDATISSAKINQLTVDKLTYSGGSYCSIPGYGSESTCVAAGGAWMPGGPANFVSMFVGEGEMTNAKIGNFIQSTNWDGINGWNINKSGTANFQNIVIRDSSGNIVLTSGGAYATAIANSNQAWSDVSGTGIPSDNADVTSSNTAAGIAGQGGFATEDQITLANISTYIATTAITNAYIGFAAVDTLQLAGQSVTIPESAHTVGAISIGTGWTTIQSVTAVSENDPATGLRNPIAISVSCLNSFKGSVGYPWQARILRGTTVLLLTDDLGWALNQALGPGAMAYSSTISKTPPAEGTYTYYFQVRATNSSAGFDSSNRSIVLLETKR